MSGTDIETRLSAARTRLIMDQPFLGALVLRLPLEAASPRWCKTTATDGRRLYYNPIYITALGVDEVQFVLAHDALHCALLHFVRREHRDKRRWDTACDYAVNLMLVHEGLKPPPNALHDERFVGMTAEEIYPYVPVECDEPMDRHLWEDSDNLEPEQSRERSSEREPDVESPQPGEAGERQAEPEQAMGGSRPPPALSKQEAEALGVQWQQRLAGAAQLALQAGRLGGGLARLVNHLLQPRVPWRALLAHHMTNVARDDYSYQRPSTRRGDPAIYPSLRSGQLRVVVAIDTSGSIGDDEMRAFVAEIDAIKSQVRAHVILLACDSQLAADGPWEYAPWDELLLPRSFAGGGGTDFTPVFHWLERQDMAPDLLLYFTDAEGTFPPRPPVTPVVWLVKGKATVPWGQRVQLN